MLKYLWVSLVVIVIDQLSKFFVFTELPLGLPVNILPFFDLLYSHNPGVAFSWLANMGPWKWYFLVALTSTLSLILLIWISRMKPWEKVQAIGMSMILGGAIGNLIDRFLHTDTVGRREGVVDFLSFYWGEHRFPSFNVADSAITLGVIVIFWFMLFVAEPKSTEQTAD